MSNHDCLALLERALRSFEGTRMALEAERDSLRAELAEANKTDQPCEHHRGAGLMIFVKTLTTQQGTVFVCEKCSKHWFRTYAALALGGEGEKP